MTSKISLSKDKINKIKNNNSLTANSYFNKSKKNSIFIKDMNTISHFNNNNNRKKLFKSVYSGFTKTTFGSIPSKTEKFILNKKINYPRFNDIKSIFYSDKLSNPGVGRYNLIKDFEITGWDTKFGGFGTRFKSYFNSLPGAGEYKPEESKIYEKNRNNIRYKSLYKKPNKLHKLLNIKNNFKEKDGPNCTTYTPIYQDEIMRIKKSYTFDSFTGRDEFTGYTMPFSKKNDYPGPGFYTNNWDLLGDNNKQLKFNYETKNNGDNFEDFNIRKNPDKFYKKFYNNRKDVAKFKLKSRSPKNNNIKVITSEELQIKNKTEKQNSKEVPQLEIILKNIDNLDNYTNNFKFYINQQKELDYIKSVLGNDNGKPDLFYLSGPRWKENKYKLKTPGPAYYFNNDLNSFK